MYIFEKLLKQLFIYKKKMRKKTRFLNNTFLTLWK